MKRWHYILAMLVVTAVIHALLRWAASNHNVRGYDVATIDRIIAALVFWSTLLMPMIVGLILSLNFMRSTTRPYWPIPEAVIIGFLMVVFFGSDSIQRFYAKLLPTDDILFPVTYSLVIVAIGLATLNSCLSFKARKMLLGSLSALIGISGLPILFMCNGWAIYFE